MIEWLEWLEGSLSNIWSSPGILIAAAADFIIIFAAIYALLYFLRGSRSIYVLFGVAVFLAIAAILANFAQLVVVSSLISELVPILGVAVIVIFQPEFRRVLARAGSLLPYKKHGKNVLSEVVNAANIMASSRTGALIVFERSIGLEGVVSDSVKLDAKVNPLLLQSIFFKNSPLHDCAVVIRNNRIIAARAVLPLTQEEIKTDAAHRSFGTRHRAAIGVTEDTDAVALVVSEETGVVSVAYKGQFQPYQNEAELLEILSDLLIEKPQGSVPFWKKILASITELQKKKAEKEQK